MAEYPEWSPPVYDTSSLPSQIYKSHLKDRPDSSTGDFVRQAKWCPDGSIALGQTESCSFQFLDLPVELLDQTLPHNIHSKQSWSLPQASPILDFAWYPRATSRDTASYCFVSSARDCPVKLLDASDGRLRASYPIVDHRERQIAPHSLAFNPMATKLYCGFEDAIEVFDLHHPGSGTRLKTTPSRKSRDGLKGIVSSLAFSLDLSSGLYAAGTLSPSPPSSSNIALFSETTGDSPVMFVGDERQDDAFGVRASVMQLMFNPTRPHLLYASFRRHPSLYCWDLRSDVSVPIQTFSLQASPPNKHMQDSTFSDKASYSPPPPYHVPYTNQKLRFDIDIGGSWLGTGDPIGNIILFDLTCSEPAGVVTPSDSENDAVAPALQFGAHDDAIGSVGFHPLEPLLLSVSGSRHYDQDDEHNVHSPATGIESDSGSEADIESEDDEAKGCSNVRLPLKRPQPSVYDDSVKLWSFKAMREETSVFSEDVDAFEQR